MQDVDLTPDGMIYDRGRGPEIKGTRITVYVIMDHYRDPEWPAERIAELYRITVPQARAALDYIDSHMEELKPEYDQMVARSKAGNPPEIRAKLAASRQKFLAMLNPEQKRRLAELDQLLGENGNGTGSGR